MRARPSIRVSFDVVAVAEQIVSRVAFIAVWTRTLTVLTVISATVAVTAGAVYLARTRDDGRS